jgi:hypothetical protein
MFFPPMFKPILGPTHPPYARTPLPRLGHDTEHSPPSCAKAKKVWTYTSTIPCAFTTHNFIVPWHVIYTYYKCYQLPAVLILDKSAQWQKLWHWNACPMLKHPSVFTSDTQLMSILTTWHNCVGFTYIILYAQKTLLLQIEAHTYSVIE